MGKQSRGLMLALLGLAIASVAALFFRESAADYREVRPGFALNPEPVIGREPIAPIPLKIELDTRKVALGRRLFHEARLSADDTISCAHCHNLSNGGMDGLPRSFGIDGKEGDINAPTVFNSGFNFSQFWDGRAGTLEEQVDFPMIHTCEMGSTWAEVIGKLEQDETYRRDFSAIYPEGINEQAVRNAIATFERSLITPNSRFDRFLRGEVHMLNQDELEGYELFKNLGCISCHQGMNVGGNMYEKIGLFGDYFADRGNVRQVDYGRYNITQKEGDRFEFRVPPLRNVALTAPYFHDASAHTLDEAVEVMGKYQLGVNLNPDEIFKVASFLKTLTGVYQAEAAE